MESVFNALRVRLCDLVVLNVPCMSDLFCTPMHQELELELVFILWGMTVSYLLLHSIALQLRGAE